MSEKISIIIPVYNVRAYLERCIMSVVNQTYNDLEIIIVDDGSTDGSEKVCEELASKDKRIKVIHKENGGLSDARNAGIKIATGRYLGFLDSDDWIDKDYYETMYQKLTQSKSDIAIIGYLWVEDDKFIKPKFYLEDKEFTSDEAVKELVKDDLLTSHAWNKLFKRELFNEIEFPKGKAYEDIFIMHKLFKNAQKIYVISDFKHYYFMHSKSIIHTLSVKNRIDEFRAFKARYEELKNIYPEMNSIMAEKVCERIINMYYINPFTKKEKEKYAKELKEVDDFLKDIKLMNSLGRKRQIMSISPLAFGIAFKLKRKIPINVKKTIKNIVKKPVLNNIEQGNNRIILMGSPEYGNIGDLAIAYFTKRFMEINSKKQFVEISEDDFNNNFNSIAKNIGKNDILLLQGGGNLGSEYVDQEKIRSKVISYFKENKIILMPQTIHFAKNEYGENLKKEITSLYSSNNNLNIFAREEISLETMKELFANNVNLVPDIVMSSTINFKKEKRSGAMLCLRSDVEGILKINDLLFIKKVVRSKFKNYYLNDTVYDTDIRLDEREKVLFDFWDKMQRSQLVITDRLHGMVFAAITGTPCLVIGNYNHKVKTCYKWFEKLGYIKFCETVNEVEKLIDTIDYKKEYTYPGDEIMDKFESMIDLLEE